MYRCMLKSKIHRAIVTETELYYEGSITIDADIMEKAGLLPYEKVEVFNMSTGLRIETYVIEGRRGTSVICLNGPAARTAQVGDEVVIVSYVWLDEKELSSHRPIIVKMK